LKKNRNHLGLKKEEQKDSDLINEITKSFDWCINNSLLPWRPLCSKYGVKMESVQDKSRIDGFRGRCDFNKFKCNSKMGIRKGTLFNFCKLTLEEIIRLIFVNFVNNDLISKDFIF